MDNGVLQLYGLGCDKKRMKAQGTPEPSAVILTDKVVQKLTASWSVD
jgi:hypothetical protein